MRSGNIRTVFLDRDGVINRKMPEGRYVTSWHEIEFLSGVVEAIRRLNEAGVRVLVVSNQRCIALGICTRAEVDRIHKKMLESLRDQGARIDQVYLCEHDRGVCDCRKPRTGLFLQALADFPQIEAATSVMIGDSFSDIEFGHRAGMRTIFIEGDPETQKEGADKARGAADAVCHSLTDAAGLILEWDMVAGL
jgi:D-glycero-D-manno-heptose 1,7-bisphosphate phosphatase